MEQKELLTRTNREVFKDFALSEYLIEKDFLLFQAEIKLQKFWFVAVDTNPTPDIPEHQVIEFAILLYPDDQTNKLVAIYVFRNQSEDLPAPFEIVQDYSAYNFESLVGRIYEMVVLRIRDELSRSGQLGRKI